MTDRHDFDGVNGRVRTGGAGVVGAFRDCTIGSAFQPIFSLSHRNPVGYEALCRAKNPDGSPLSPLTLFGQSYGESDDVLLDRLCRAVHVQNFAACADGKSWLFLNVNPLVTVVGKNYGSFFSEMLAHHGISPSQVVIEILEQNIRDESILSAAVSYYKELGCLVAIDDFGASHSNFDRVWHIRPDIVKFDRSIIVQAEADRVVRKALPSLVSLIQELDCIALMEGVETEQQALIAIDSNVDLVQGYYFGHPQAALVDSSARDDRLVQLCGKHAELASGITARYRETVGRCMAEFKAMLRRIKAGYATNEEACAQLRVLPDVMRIYFLDESGRQIGSNISGKQTAEDADPRYKALTEATEANWSRRDYFKQAMLHPGEIQVTRPYRSLTGKSQCITLSVLIDTPSGKRVACLDLDCA
ncbi:MAG TPA: EAL domain-containing protein [Gallionella sp.]|nr:EAL domain-containing protein [Gallionella sp.]